MAIPAFVLERYFARHEFTAPYLMCSSDVEALTLSELLGMADEEGREWWDSLALGYTDYPGDGRLRREIAGLYGGLAEEHIYCFSGAQEAIYWLFQALLREPGAHAIVTWPGYQSLYEVPRALGCEVSLLELRAEENWQWSEQRLLELWRPNTRLVAVNFPHNPTGATLSTEQLGRLANICEERGAWLFCDEVYKGLEWHATQVEPAAVELSPRAISLGVMSKSFGLAGLRVGWLACRDAEILSRVAILKDYSTICNAAPSEALAFIGLRAKERLWQRSRHIVMPNLDLFAGVVAEFSHLLDWVPPRAGTMGFPRLKVGAVDEFANKLREQTGVLVLPGSVYAHSGNRFRVGLGRRNFPLVLDRFRAFLNEGPPSPREAPRGIAGGNGWGWGNEG